MSVFECEIRFCNFTFIKKSKTKIFLEINFKLCVSFLKAFIWPEAMEFRITLHTLRLKTDFRGLHLLHYIYGFSDDDMYNTNETFRQVELKFIFSNNVIWKMFLFLLSNLSLLYGKIKTIFPTYRYNVSHYMVLKIFPSLWKDSHVLLNFIFFQYHKIEHNESPKEFRFIFYISGLNY